MTDGPTDGETNPLLKNTTDERTIIGGYGHDLRYHGTTDGPFAARTDRPQHRRTLSSTDGSFVAWTDLL